MTKDDMIKVLEKVELAARRCGTYWPQLDSFSNEIMRIIEETRNEQ